MRLQCNLLSLFLLGLVVIASIVEASGKKKGKKGKNKHAPSSSIIVDDSSPNSSSSLSSTCERDVAPDIIKVLEEKGFESIKQNWGKWRYRKDLFDYVVTKSVEFIIGFINQVEDAKRPILAALFIKRLDKLDQVLKKIEYNDI